MECKFAQPVSQGFIKYATCTLTNDMCYFTRWCANDCKLKNTDKYIACKVRTKELEDKN